MTSIGKLVIDLDAGRKIDGYIKQLNVSKRNEIWQKVLQSLTYYDIIINVKRKEEKNMKTLAETLFEYYQQNEDDFNHDIEELDSWNGYLGDRRLMLMDELDEFYQGKEATEILRRAYFGHDDDNWHEENGERVYGEFNPNRDYFYFNGYGNLVSTDECDYSDFLDENFVQDIIADEYALDLSEGAQEIIDNYDEEGEDDEH